MNAEQTIRTVLQSAIPPGVPLSFNKILSARFVGSGKKRVATADLEMFDGLPATVECWCYGPGWAHRWTSMIGGDISWEGDLWKRSR